MAETKPAPTLADYLVQAISPALIMALVGSLIFFLLEILYAGNYSGKLQWTFFFFIFGAVLISRISMRPDIAGRATMYGLMLGVLVWLAMLQFVEYEGAIGHVAWAINLGLIALTWWCAHQLTKDCTHIDEEADADDAGALSAAGLEESTKPADSNGKSETWFERHRKERERARKKRTLGVWVVYFSLAALPIFGLGQSFIPVEDTERRRYVFWLMAIYLAGGLGLLLSTTFLGLRKYLRHRNVRMPASIVGTWLMIGVSISCVLLLLGAVLPRPRAEYQVFDFATKAKSGEQEASDASVGDEGAGKSDPDNKNRDGKPQDSKEKRDGEGGREQKDKQDDSRRSDDKDAKEKSKQGSKDESNGDRDGEKSGGSQRRRDDRRGEQRNDQSREAAQDEKGSRSNDKSKDESSSDWWKRLSEIVKWILIAIVGLVALVMLFRALLGFLSNFSAIAKGWLEAWRRFWQNLFTKLQNKESSETEQAVEEEAPPPIPFAAFSNPFWNGRSHEMTVEELVRYSFAAVQAWAAEQDLARWKGETAIEHADRIGQSHSSLRKDVRRLAILYARLVYGMGHLPERGRKVAESTWESLLKNHKEPVFA